MTKDYKILAWVIGICVVLQLALAPNIAIAGAKPNFLLVAVVCAGVLAGSRTGVIVGFSAGLLYDLIAQGPFGTMIITLALVGFVVGYFARGLMLESMGMTIVVFVVSTLFAEFVDAVLLTIAGVNSSFLTALYMNVLPSALYDTVFAIICFLIMRHFMAPASARMTSNTKLR